MRLRDSVKLSIKANNIINDVDRTETAIDRFINKYCGKEYNEKFTIDGLLDIYTDGDERNFIKKYAETNLAYSGTTITICAYIFAIVTILFTLIWPYLQENISNIIVKAYLLVVCIILIKIVKPVYFDILPKLDRNKAIIMSIEDKWNDQDESHSNSNTKNKGDDDATMNTGYKPALIGWICGALLVMVTMIVTYWMGIDYWPSSDDVTLFLTFTLVAVTAMYAWSTHTIVKQGADREMIAFLERRLEKFYMPMLALLEFANTPFQDDPDNRFGKPGPSTTVFLEGKLSPDYRIKCEEMLDEIIQFKYLAKSNIQDSLPSILELFKIEFMNTNDIYITTVNSFTDEINHDITEYTKKLKSLLKEE